MNDAAVALAHIVAVNLETETLTLKGHCEAMKTWDSRAHLFSNRGVVQHPVKRGGIMQCSQCIGIETTFDRKLADKYLKQYREKGPPATTRLLLDGLKVEGVQGLTLLDIGGGVGTIPNELLRAGISEASHVDASAAFIAAAEEEATLQNHADHIRFYHGDFVNIAPELPPADIVTLDRVICCYHDMDSLVGLSSARARKWYGVVYPRDTWWVKMGLALGNLFYRLQRNPFRSYVHSTQEVEAKAQGNGLKRHSYHQTFLWQVVIYARDTEP